MIAYHIVLFSIYLATGIFFLGAALYWAFEGIEDLLEGFICVFLFVAGLAVTGLSSFGMIYGLQGNVHFELKNTDGAIVIKDVAPFGYKHDGNCFRFNGDDRNYCGWEVNYEYNKD